MPLLFKPPRSMMALLALGLTTTPTATRAAAPVDPSAGVTCSDPATIQRLLASQLRGDPPKRDDGWRVSYRVESSSGDRWMVRVEVLGDDGRLYMTRSLSHSTGDCQTLAEAAALIVERFFTDLDWTSGRPLPPPAELSMAAAPTPSPLNMLVTARVGAWTRSQRTAAGVLGLRWERRWLDGELSLVLPAVSQEEMRPDGGKASLSAIALTASVGLRWQPRRLQLRAGPIAVVDHEWARTEGIRLQGNNTRLTLAAGLSAGATYAVSQRWRLGLDVWGTMTALGDRFVVEGWGTVLTPPRFQIAALLGVNYVLSP